MFSVTLLLSRNQQLTALLKKEEKKNDKNKAIKNKTQFISNSESERYFQHEKIKFVSPSGHVISSIRSPYL